MSIGQNVRVVFVSFIFFEHLSIKYTNEMIIAKQKKAYSPLFHISNQIN